MEIEGSYDGGGLEGLGDEELEGRNGNKRNFNFSIEKRIYKIVQKRVNNQTFIIFRAPFS